MLSKGCRCFPVSFDRTSHASLSFDCTSHPLTRFDHTSHPIFSIDYTPIRWSFKPPRILFSKGVTSSTRTCHSGFRWPRVRDALGKDACRDRRCCGQEHRCAHQAATQSWRKRVSTSCWRRVGDKKENADFARRSSSDVRPFRRRTTTSARRPLATRVRAIDHEYEMFVRTVQDVSDVSGTFIIGLLRLEVGTATNA